MELKLWVISLISTSSWSCVLVGILAVFWFWYNKKEKKRNLEANNNNDKHRVPKGNSGWPLVGETIEFIACGYTSQPVRFMEKRRSL